VQRQSADMYRSIANTIRDIAERKSPGAHGAMAPDGGPEKDMNDQIAVGSYQTKSFEMSDLAQKLYSNLPPDTPSVPAEAAAITLDRLFDIFRDAVAKGFINSTDMETARAHVDKIDHLAKEMKLIKQHGEITNDIMRHLADYAEDNPARVITPDEQKHPTDDPRFGTDSKDYNTDKTNDRDVDNVKNFLIRRSLKVQRKLKIIDND
jgi:hypothetical protein